MRSLENRQVPGVDRVTAEIIILQQLHALLTHTCAWKKTILVPVLEKGDSRECKNYRGIRLLSVLSQLFMKIIR